MGDGDLVPEARTAGTRLRTELRQRQLELRSEFDLDRVPLVVNNDVASGAEFSPSPPSGRFRIDLASSTR